MVDIVDSPRGDALLNEFAAGVRVKRLYRAAKRSLPEKSASGRATRAVSRVSSIGRKNITIPSRLRSRDRWKTAG